MGVHKTREQEQEEKAMLMRWKTEEQVLTQNPGRSTARRGGGVIAESALFIALTQPGRQQGQQGQQGQGPFAPRPLAKRDGPPAHHLARLCSPRPNGTSAIEKPRKRQIARRMPGGGSRPIRGGVAWAIARDSSICAPDDARWPTRFHSGSLAWPVGGAP